MNKASLPEHIFRQYDIRGTVGTDITVEGVKEIARTFAGVELRKRKGDPLNVVLARDVRRTSEELAAGALAGLLEAGANVWDIGVVPTPVAYFAMGKWNASGGVMVTASHNPRDQNGLKLREGDMPFYGDDIQQLRQRLGSEFKAPETAEYRRRDPYPEYFEAVVEGIKLERKLKVVLDVGNGAATLTAPKVLEMIGCEVEVMFPELDGGEFAGRGPNPLKGPAVELLSCRVQRVGADVGISLDADGDRIIICDEQGNYIPPDKATVPYIRDILQHDRGAVFVTEVRCSFTVRDFIAKRASKGKEALIMTACGYPFIISKMREVGAAMGFEKTGHYYFDNPLIKFDDATYAAARLVAVLSRADKPLSEIMAEAPEYFTADDLRWHCPDEHKFEVVDRAIEKFKQMQDWHLILVDGVRAEKEDRWALIRAANTGPELVMCWEGKTPEIRDDVGEQLQQLVSDIMEQMGLEPGIVSGS